MAELRSSSVGLATFDVIMLLLDTFVLLLILAADIFIFINRKNLAIRSLFPSITITGSLAAFFYFYGEIPCRAARSPSVHLYSHCYPVRI